MYFKNICNKNVAEGAIECPFKRCYYQDNWWPEMNKRWIMKAKFS